MAVILPDYGEEKSHWLMRRLRVLWRIGSTRVANLFGDMLPKGLYGRALLIIIAPIVLLESVVAFTFMERHWSQVTERLSEATARDIAALVEIYEAYPLDRDFGKLIDIAQNKMGLYIPHRVAQWRPAVSAKPPVLRPARTQAD